MTEGGGAIVDYDRGCNRTELESSPFSTTPLTLRRVTIVKKNTFAKV